MTNKLSLNDAIKIAESREGKCLSKEYINGETPMLWECNKNHRWTAQFRSIKNRHSWCPHCANKKLSIAVAKELAHAKNGKCISENYINNNLPLLWECENGHQFRTSLAHVKNEGTWCRECKKLGLEFAQNLAHRKGGVCLSNSYCNKRSQLSWSCSEGHSWLAKIGDIKRGTWCPHCRRESERLGIECAKELARSKNGECLSITYINTKTHLLWKCNKNHTWYSTFASIKYSNSWCPYCSSTKLGISEAKAIAYSRGGDCLTDSYVNCNGQLLWQCSKNHQWYARLSYVKNNNTWCPYCSKYKRENLCREIVSKYLGPPSKIRRPDFLKTLDHPTGLELDIYYPQYEFATEVQGEQHEKYIEFFHRGDPNNFIKQQERDQLKKELCEENLIALRYVWYFEDPYIVIPEHLRELGLIE